MSRLKRKNVAHAWDAIRGRKPAPRARRYPQTRVRDSRVGRDRGDGGRPAQRACSRGGAGRGAPFCGHRVGRRGPRHRRAAWPRARHARAAPLRARPARAASLCRRMGPGRANDASDEARDARAACGARADRGPDEGAEPLAEEPAKPRSPILPRRRRARGSERRLCAIAIAPRRARGRTVRPPPPSAHQPPDELRDRAGVERARRQRPRARVAAKNRPRRVLTPPPNTRRMVRSRSHTVSRRRHIAGGRPLKQLIERGTERLPPRRQVVLHARRALRIGDTSHDSILLQLPRISSHDLRRTFGTWLRADLLGGGVPVTEVAAMLGHADSRMAEPVYTKLPSDLLRDLLTGLCQPAAGHALPEAGKDGEDGEERSRNPAELVPRGGIEPPTRGFSVPCSTD